MTDEHELESPDTGRPWMVANFPTGLRREITQAAKRLDVTVAELLVSHFERHGIAGVAISTPKLSDKLDAPARPRLGNADLIAIASSPTIARWLRYHAARELAERMGAAPPASKTNLVQFRR